MREKRISIKGIIEEFKNDWMIIMLIIGSLAAGAAIYPHLPEQIPSHWNVHGQVDQYSSRLWGALGLPLLSAGIYIMMVLLPSIDPRRENYKRFKGAYRSIKSVLVIFFVGLWVMVMVSSLGYSIPVDRFVIVGIGLLFMVVGNFMGQLRNNYFVGIKTPWTLASEEVWRKTHRLSSRVWVACGGLIALTGLILGGEKGVLFIGASIAAAVIIPVVYSYIIFRRRDAA
ncbi:MAG: integral membrane protein [Peptococcaceae bacterium BICA1-7]|nr:MAG: integral membrane protein [Peptococcaceae bacterium BICA1-7]HBV97680.1 hypothetical protein [Desulfotomaculum sp.]